MKDHEIRELVSELTQVAKDYALTQQLRSRIGEVVIKHVKKATPTTSTWDKYENVDRQGGSFSQSEMDAYNANNY